MRIAFITTAVAAVIGAPLLVTATGPQMTANELISAVRCTAYEDIASPDAALSEIKWRLNSEVRRHDAETAALARAEARAGARLALSDAGANMAGDCRSVIAASAGVGGAV